MADTTPDAVLAAIGSAPIIPPIPGLAAKAAAAEAFRGCAQDFVRIGDCGKVGRVQTCVHTAYHAAMMLGCY